MWIPAWSLDGTTSYFQFTPIAAGELSVQPPAAWAPSHRLLWLPGLGRHSWPLCLLAPIQMTLAGTLMKCSVTA